MRPPSACSELLAAPSTKTKGVRLWVRLDYRQELKSNLTPYHFPSAGSLLLPCNTLNFIEKRLAILLDECLEQRPNRLTAAGLPIHI